MRGLRYLLGIHRVDIMKEIVHVMVKQADNGNPSCEKGTGVIPQSNRACARDPSSRPETPCQLRTLTSVDFHIFNRFPVILFK